MGVLRAAVRLVELPGDDRRRVVEAALQLTLASLELRLAPRGTMDARLGALQTGEEDGGADGAQLREAERIGRSVSRVADHLPWRPTCLRQALAAQRMLRRRRIPCRLHLGVAGPSSAAAHAWVTVAARPVVGRAGLERFVPLAQFD